MLLTTILFCFGGRGLFVWQLATCHEDSKGIFLWTNTLVSRPGETGLALTHSKKAIRVDLPLANAAAAGSDPMDIDDVRSFSHRIDFRFYSRKLLTFSRLFSQ